MCWREEREREACRPASHGPTPSSSSCCGSGIEGAGWTEIVVPRIVVPGEGGVKRRPRHGMWMSTFERGECGRGTMDERWGPPRARRRPARTLGCANDSEPGHNKSSDGVSFEIYIRPLAPPTPKSTVGFFFGGSPSSLPGIYHPSLQRIVISRPDHNRFGVERFGGFIGNSVAQQ